MGKKQMRCYTDPAHLTGETGMTQRQIVLKAKRMGLATRKIYGRTWIAKDEVHRLTDHMSKGNS